MKNISILIVFMLVSILAIGSISMTEGIINDPTHCCTPESVDWLPFCCCLTGKPITVENCGSKSKCYVTFQECLENCSISTCDVPDFKFQTMKTTK
ncbi:unnamed protein product [Lactuca virosa]|uniref:Uncharacterized protein n=1 Tax=Lactuca virosa TaxID=75947 RepID=A0AAU9LC74_9ASTR|nr:unnamed protein product [Lactuca virosa]